MYEERKMSTISINAASLKDEQERMALEYVINSNSDTEENSL